MQSNKKIALFVPSLAGGGAERVMLNLANGFAGRGIAVDLVLSTPAGRYLEQLDSRVRLIQLESARVSSSLPKLIRYLRKEKPAAILATQVHANVALLIARALSRTSTRIVVRDSNSMLGASAHVKESLPARIVNWLARILYARADGVVAVCHAMKTEIAQRTGVSANRITVIYNPVDSTGIASKAREMSGHNWLDSIEAKVVLSVGRLEKQKDFASLIRAVAILRQEQDARLVILGEGRLRGELTELAASLGIAEHVDLPGFVDNPYAYIARADVFVLSSLFEGLPNVLIEALTLGTPIVATDCRTGPREILRDGKDGTLVPVQDPAALARAIASTMQIATRPVPDPESVARFSLDRVLDQYYEILCPRQEN